MRTRRALGASLAVLAGAWLMAIPAFYLLYDFWMRGLDTPISGGELLRPYAFFVGVCPLILFWTGSIFATLGGAQALGKAGAPRPLTWAVLLLGASGSLLGTAVGVPTLAVLAVGLGRGDVPLGLLAVLGGLSAMGIWVLRRLLGRLERAPDRCQPAARPLSGRPTHH